MSSSGHSDAERSGTPLTEWRASIEMRFRGTLRRFKSSPSQFSMLATGPAISPRSRRLWGTSRASLVGCEGTESLFSRGGVHGPGSGTSNGQGSPAAGIDGLVLPGPRPTQGERLTLSPEKQGPGPRGPKSVHLFLKVIRISRGGLLPTCRDRLDLGGDYRFSSSLAPSTRAFSASKSRARCAASLV